MQIIRVPTYDFRKLSTGQLLSTRALEASTTLVLESVTGFSSDEFAILGYDNDRENNEIATISAISSPNLTVGALSYEHQPDFLVYPCPYDQIELYKKVSGGSMQLMERKSLDVDDPYTVFFDATALPTDTYEYKYRNSVSEAVSSAATTGMEYVKAQDPYVTPAQVIQYMGNPTGLTASDPNLVMLCNAYSDQLDHAVGRYQNERLWYHYEKVIIPMDKINSSNRARVKNANQKPIIECVEAYVVDPVSGRVDEFDKPYEVLNRSTVYLPNLDDVTLYDTDRLHMIVKVGFFESDNIPQDIRSMLCHAIAMHIRREDMLRRYVHHSGQLVSGETGSDAYVRQVTVGKYTKMYFESAAESNGQRVNAKGLEAINVAFDQAMIDNMKDVLRPYKQTFSMSFI